MAKNKKFPKVKLSYAQKFLLNLVLILGLLFLCYLSIDHQKLTKNAAIESLLRSNLIHDYKVIGLISHEIAEYPKNEFRYVVETKDEYLMANIYKKGFFYKQGKVYQGTKGDVTLIPLEVNDRLDYKFVHFVMITTNKSIAFAKLNLQCRWYENDYEDRKELVFQDDYSREATLLENGCFYFRIDRKNMDCNAIDYEFRCFMEIGNMFQNLDKFSLKGIRFEVELYNENHEILEVRELSMW